SPQCRPGRAAATTTPPDGGGARRDRAPAGAAARLLRRHGAGREQGDALKEQEPKRRWSLVQLAERVGGTVEGDPDLKVSEIAGVEEATPESLVRVEEARYLEAAVAGCGAALLIGEQLPSPGKP